MNDCIFCKVISGELPSTKLYEDDEFMVIKDIHPAAPVHLLIMPKKHVRDISEADEKLICSLFALVKKIIKREDVNKFRIVHNGRGAAVVDHLHVHLLCSVDKTREL